MSKRNPSALSGRSDIEVTRAFVRALDACAKNLAAHRQFVEHSRWPHPPVISDVLLGDREYHEFCCQNQRFSQRGDALWRAIAERLPEMTRLALRYGRGSDVFCVLDRFSAEDLAAARAAAFAVAGDTTKASAEGGARKRPAGKKRNRPPLEPKPLTEKQVEAAQIVAECKGNIAEAARRLGVDRATVKQHYEAAGRKMGKTVVKRTTRPIPQDRRGQPAVSEDRRRS